MGNGAIAHIEERSYSLIREVTGFIFYGTAISLNGHDITIDHIYWDKDGLPDLSDVGITKGHELKKWIGITEAETLLKKQVADYKA